MRSLDQILTTLRQIKPMLELRYPLRSMGVFGSYARGEQSEESDLDLLVELGDGMTLIDFVRLQQEIGDAVGINVDLAEKEALKPRIAPYILKEAVMV
ncbi:MAG: nucleotidyltransferase family protein [Alphaproteobacteria bacterium]|nr:nucleotidyltransferase family protein [Alphaproteobacteria bacterium]